jgi:hypothetical protein
MKRLAFSVWPDLPKNKPLPDYLRNKAESRLELLESGGFEFFHLSSCDQDDYARKLVERYNLKPSIRKATSISDYTRVAEMVKLLENGVDEIFYLDYDFHLWELPKGYGVSLESHILPDEDGSPVKLWYRGQNSTYYLSKDHLPILKRHLGYLQDYLKKTDFQPKYCYPMNYLWEFEQDIGYIPGYRDVGTFACGQVWYETVEKILQLSVFLGDMPDTSITGVNLRGSSNLDFGGISTEFQEISKLRDSTNAGKFSEEEVRSILKGLRIRPNYNSLGKRENLKRFIGK